jgi:hypothetical protein
VNLRFSLGTSIRGALFYALAHRKKAVRAEASTTKTFCCCELVARLEAGFVEERWVVPAGSRLHSGMTAAS